MKNRIKYLLIVILSLSIANARAGSLTVVHEDYAAAVAAAKAENKLLLIDFYTTWCGPCKVLSKQLLDNEQYSEAIGQHFVLLKYDAEKDTAFHLSKKYHINSYPTGIVLNADGRLIAKKRGVSTAEGNVDIINYMAFLNDAVQNQRNEAYIAGVSTKIDMNYPKFYAEYINRTAKYNKEAIEEYWNTLSKDDYMKEVPFAILSYFGAMGPIEEYFTSHMDDYKKLYGEDDVKEVCYKIVSTGFR
ncbi:MAG: thioredoxin family protein, partial [Chitinophagaceae bacterium]|nr:thioredoxin family protein [Chitinophagaceae bacterium]